MSYGSGPVRIGHGPFDTWFGTWPPSLVRWLFYRPRPDIITSKTRIPEWDKLHSEWRFFQALFCYIGPPSHILYNIKWPFGAVCLITCAMTVWGYGVQNWGMQVIDRYEVVVTGVRMTSFAMSLMLTFRLQRCYERWSLARSSLAGVGNGTTTIFMLAATWIKDPDIVDDFRRFCIVWPFSIMQVCMNSKSLDPRAARLLHPAELQIYSGSRKGRQVVVTKVRQLAADAGLNTEQFIAMENAIAMTWKSAGDALRIRFQAMPHGVTLLCTGFVQIWCMMIPIGLSSDDGNNYTLTLVASLLIALMLLGVDEVATQMEEPFKMMPLDDIVVTYDRDINRIADELRMLREAEIQVRADKRAERAAQQLAAKEEFNMSRRMRMSPAQSRMPSVIGDCPPLAMSPRIASSVFSKSPVDHLEYPLTIQTLLGDADRAQGASNAAEHGVPHPLAESAAHTSFRRLDSHLPATPSYDIGNRPSLALSGVRLSGGAYNDGSGSQMAPTPGRGPTPRSQSKMLGLGMHPHSRQALLEEEEMMHSSSESQAHTSTYTPPHM